MSSKAIIVENLSKSYKLGSRANAAQTFFGVLKSQFSSTPKEKTIAFRALDNVSLDVVEGEILGIIGHNGAGKSTLLKILSRIVMPDKGRAIINGSLNSLLEVGTGFHPELTGRENIFLNGTMLGMSREEIKRLLPEIIEFAGVDAFIDTPFKRYSSGMQVRLGFAVAAHLRAQVLLLDEVLAVGDVAFQQKCLGKIDEVAKSGRTILFVSHNMGAIKSLCKRVICLERGRLIADGAADAIISQYLRQNHAPEAELGGAELERKTVLETPADRATVRFKKAFLSGEDGQPKNSFYSDEAIAVTFDVEAFEEIRDLRAIVQLVTEDHTVLCTTQASDDSRYSSKNSLISRGVYRFAVKIPPNTLGEQHYYVTLRLIHPFTEHVVLHEALGFKVQFKGYNNVQTGTFGDSYFRPQWPWEVKQLQITSLAGL